MKLAVRNRVEFPIVKHFLGQGSHFLANGVWLYLYPGWLVVIICLCFEVPWVLDVNDFLLRLLWTLSYIVFNFEFYRLQMVGTILPIMTRSIWNFSEFDQANLTLSKPTYMQTAALARVGRSGSTFGSTPQSTSITTVFFGLITTLCEYPSTTVYSSAKALFEITVGFFTWQKFRFMCESSITFG